MKLKYILFFLPCLVAIAAKADQGLVIEANHRGVPLAYRFSFQNESQYIKCLIFVSFNAERFSYPGSDFPSTPSMAEIIITSKDLACGSERTEKKNLSTESVMEFFLIISQSEIFSLPEKMLGPEQRNAVVGGSIAVFERVYNNQSIRIERNILASEPAKVLATMLYEFLMKEVGPGGKGQV